MKKLLHKINNMPTTEQAKIFLLILEKNIHHLKRDKNVYTKTRKVLNICSNYINTGEIPIKELDNLLTEQDTTNIFYITNLFDLDKNGEFKFPLEASILSLPIQISAILMDHYVTTTEGSQALHDLIEKENLKEDEDRLDFSGFYMGNYTIDEVLETARKGGLLDPEIFSQFGIDLKDYDLEAQASYL